MDWKLGGLIAAACFALASQANADRPATRAEKLSLCETYESYAATVMRARQNNVPMSALMRISEKGDAEYRKVNQRIVEMAYQQLRWPTEAMQRDAIQEFQNNIYLECVKANHL